MTHPVKPTPTLIQHWIDTIAYPHNDGVGPSFNDAALATLAAQWGADQELEACCLWLNGGSKIDYDTAALLRDARRPKPESAKEKALKALKKGCFPSNDEIEVIKAALEGLP